MEKKRKQSYGIFKDTNDDWLRVFTTEQIPTHPAYIAMKINHINIIEQQSLKSTRVAMPGADVIKINLI